MMLTLTLKVYMHKGCTRDAHRGNTPAVACPQKGGDTGGLTSSWRSEHTRTDAPRQPVMVAVYAQRRANMGKTLAAGKGVC